MNLPGNRREKRDFLKKVREIAKALGDELVIEKDNRDEVVVRTTTPHYISRGRIYELILPNGHDVSVKLSSWVAEEPPRLDQEYSLEDFIAVEAEDYERFGSEYTESV